MVHPKSSPALLAKGGIKQQSVADILSARAKKTAASAKDNKLKIHRPQGR